MHLTLQMILGTCSIGKRKPCVESSDVPLMITLMLWILWRGLSLGLFENKVRKEILNLNKNPSRRAKDPHLSHGERKKNGLRGVAP